MGSSREAARAEREREADRQPRAASCGSKEKSRAELGRRREEGQELELESRNISEQKGCCPMHFCCF